MKIKDRIRELRRVPASQLVTNPKNWRNHSAEQTNVLQGLLTEIGLSNALLARELPTGELMLIDGHLRAKTVGEELVPVLVLDVTEAEADKLLATLDPLAAMATADTTYYQNLIAGVQTNNTAIAELLAKTAYTAETPVPAINWSINDTAVKQAAQRLEKQFEGEKDLEQVICPHCGNEFHHG